MNNSVSQTQNNNKCPHGYPIGACPICNGMSKSKPKDKPKNKPDNKANTDKMLARMDTLERNVKNAKKTMDVADKVDYYRHQFWYDLQTAQR